MPQGYASNGVGQVKSWESLGEYLDEESRYEPFDRYKNNSWYGRLDHEQAVNYARTGDESLVARAQEILTKVEAVTAALPTYGWTRGLQGARVDVPSYLAGSPACFKRRVKRPRDVRHVRIYVGTVCSSGIPAETMLRRGLYILGLVEALQAAQVHVELFAEYDVVACGGPHNGKLVIHTVKLDEPINLSVQGFCLAHPAFTRHVMYTMGWHLGETDRALGYVGLADEVRAALNLDPGDVFIPGVHLEDELCREPERWLRERISQLVGGQEGV